MGFWKWYLSLFKKESVLRWVKTPGLEFTLGLVVAVLLSILLSLYFTPLWLLLTIPIGVTITVHGWWRLMNVAGGMIEWEK